MTIDFFTMEEANEADYVAAYRNPDSIVTDSYAISIFRGSEFLEVRNFVKLMRPFNVKDGFFYTLEKSTILDPQQIFRESFLIIECQLFPSRILKISSRETEPLLLPSSIA